MKYLPPHCEMSPDDVKSYWYWHAPQAKVGAPKPKRLGKLKPK